MKRGAWAFLGLVLLASSFRALELLHRISLSRRPAPAPTVRPRPPSVEPLPPDVKRRPSEPAPPAIDSYAPHVATRGHFERRDSQWAHTLSYGFVDHHRREQTITCDISRADHELQLQRYGYDPKALERELDARLMPFVQAELRSRGLEAVVHMTFKGGGAYEARSSFTDETPVDERVRLAGEVKRFYAWLDAGYEREQQRVEQALYAERGVRLSGNRLTPDHVGLAVRAARPLADCFRALARASSGDSDRRRLGLFLAFLQEIPYEVPPDRYQGREILGLFVPTEVLVGRHGDCDSKAVTFASLWRNFDTPLLLISLPRHMLLGVAVTPAPGEHYVQVGNRYFVLCEVAGPGKLHPGREPLPGAFEYILIEPATSGRVARGRSS
ncbi:MAG TPA: hypothetical protein VIZ31_06330 [Vicinamibacteria bacterium]